MKFSSNYLKRAVALLLFGSQAVTLFSMDLSVSTEIPQDSGLVYFHMPSPESSPTSEPRKDSVELDAMAAEDTLPRVTTIAFTELTDEENKLIDSENISDQEKSYCKSCIQKLKGCGIWSANIFKRQIFNVLGVLNMIVALMVIYDFANNKGNPDGPDAELITPQWILGTDAALSLAALAATSYGQYCKNKVDKIQNASTKIIDSLSLELENQKSKCQRAGQWLKQNGGYLYSGLSAAFAAAIVIDSMDDDFEIPRWANFADNIQAFIGSIGLFAAQHYQNKLQKLKEAKESTSLLLDEENQLPESIPGDIAEESTAA